MDLSINKMKTGAIKFWNKNRSYILTGTGIALNATATVLAFRNAPKAYDAIDKERARVNAEEAIGSEADIFEERDLTAVEKLKTTWKYVTPSIALMLVGDACIILSDKIDAGKIAALGVTLERTQDYIQKYEAKTAEVVGKGKATQVHDAVMNDISNEHTVDSSRIIDVGCTGPGIIEWYDPRTDLHFYANAAYVTTAVAKWDAHIMADEESSYEYLLQELNLPIPELARYAGMTTKHLRRYAGSNGHLELRPTSMFKSDGTTMAVLDFNCKLCTVEGF